MTHANARDHVDLWRDVVRRAPAELRAAPAALLGFAAWLSGHGALAWCAVELAQESDPDYGLAAPAHHGAVRRGAAVGVGADLGGTRLDAVRADAASSTDAPRV